MYRFTCPVCLRPTTCCFKTTNVLLQADQCKPQQIANIMWAFGTLSYKPQEHLLNVLASQAVSKLTDFNPQNLANFIWAYARCKIECPHCMTSWFHMHEH